MTSVEGTAYEAPDWEETLMVSLTIRTDGHWFFYNYMLVNVAIEKYRVIFEGTHSAETNDKLFEIAMVLSRL
jgi:hypothetical protein